MKKLLLVGLFLISNTTQPMQHLSAAKNKAISIATSIKNTVASDFSSRRAMYLQKYLH